MGMISVRPKFAHVEVSIRCTCEEPAIELHFVAALRKLIWPIPVGISPIVGHELMINPADFISNHP